MTELIRVVMVRTVVTPRPTLAGAAPRFSQKDTQDITTIRLEGMYTWHEKNVLIVRVQDRRGLI